MAYNLISFSGAIIIAIPFYGMNHSITDGFNPEGMSGCWGLKNDPNVASLGCRYSQVWAFVPLIMHTAGSS
jgi:hypothetical protein